MKTNQIATIVHKFGFDLFVSIPPVRTRGGLLFLWRAYVPVLILGSSQFMISHVFLYLTLLHQAFLLTMAYGPSSYNEKCLFWDSLHTLTAAHSEPWLLIGDFNAAVNQFEKRGGVGSGGDRSPVLPLVVSSILLIL